MDPAVSIITYQFDHSDGRTWSFDVDLRRSSAQGARRTPGEHPDWTRLEFHRCSHCPLSPGSCERCPIATDTAPILEKFANISSTARVHVTVRCPERCCSAETDLQTALKTLLGLVMATSDCPIMAPLRSQALFHLPFASIEETLYRAAGDYLLKQYFVMRDGGKPDFTLKGLDRLYQDVAILDLHFFKRIQEAFSEDANVNAIVVLRSMSDIVGISLNERLQGLRDQMEAR